MHYCMSIRDLSMRMKLKNIMIIINKLNLKIEVTYIKKSKI